MKSIEAIFAECEKVGSWYGLSIQSVEQRNQLNDTVLHTVCSWGQEEDVKVLLMAGADPNALGDQDATPLFNAVIGGSARVVELLLKAGADCGKKNAYDRSVLEYAKNINAPQAVIDLLSSVGARTVTSKRRTPRR